MAAVVGANPGGGGPRPCAEPGLGEERALPPRPRMPPGGSCIGGTLCCCAVAGGGAACCEPKGFKLLNISAACAATSRASPGVTADMPSRSSPSGRSGVPVRPCPCCEPGRLPLRPGFSCGERGGWPAGRPLLLPPGTNGLADTGGLPLPPVPVPPAARRGQVAAVMHTQGGQCHQHKSVGWAIKASCSKVTVRCGPYLGRRWVRALPLR